MNIDRNLILHWGMLCKRQLLRESGEDPFFSEEPDSNEKGSAADYYRYTEEGTLGRKDVKKAVSQDATEYAIPEDTMVIGMHAFEGMSNLKSVTIPESVTEIDDYAFQDCSGLEEIVIPDTVERIGDYAFLGCSGLKSVKFSDSVKTIGACAFEGCSGIETVDIPESFETIGWRAFWNCTSLTKATLNVDPQYKIPTIEGGVFGGCTSLNAVTFKGEGITQGYLSKLESQNKDDWPFGTTENKITFEAV